MKRTIRLTESDLHKVIEESVKRVLNENENLHSQERIYGIICNLESDIKTVISNTDSSSGQAFGSPEEKLQAITNALSHIDPSLSQETESSFNKLIEVISELQSIRIKLKQLGADDTYWGHKFNTPNGTVGLTNY